MCVCVCVLCVLCVVFVLCVLCVSVYTYDFSKKYWVQRCAGVCIYNGAVFSAALIPIIIYIEPSSPVGAVLLRGVIVAYVSVFTMTILYAQRFYMIFTKQTLDIADADDAVDRRRSAKDSSSDDTSVDTSRASAPRLHRQASTVRFFLTFSNLHVSGYSCPIAITQREQRLCRSSSSSS